MSKMRRYCGIKRADLDFDISIEPIESEPSERGSLLGDKIVDAMTYGADLGVTVPVSYDDEVIEDSDSHEVDMLSSPNHDFFDIAESTGHMVEAFAGPKADEQTE